MFPFQKNPCQLILGCSYSGLSMFLDAPGGSYSVDLTRGICVLGAWFCSYKLRTPKVQLKFPGGCRHDGWTRGQPTNATGQQWLSPPPLLSNALCYVTNQSTNQPQHEAPATFPWIIVGTIPSSKFWNEETSMMNCNKMESLYESME